MSMRCCKTQPGCRRGSWRLWALVVLAFVILIGAWTSLILIARSHPTETVPLEDPTEDASG